jgi:hypothetical protein
VVVISSRPRAIAVVFSRAINDVATVAVNAVLCYLVVCDTGQRKQHRRDNPGAILARRAVEQYDAFLCVRYRCHDLRDRCAVALRRIDVARVQIDLSLVRDHDIDWR